jgi:hypothetical protein
MPYGTQATELARCATRNHGDLREVVFLSGNNDYEARFADGVALRPHDDASLQHEYGTYAGYGEIARELGGTHPYSLLAFGYHGTGTGCFTTFLKTAGFQVSENDMAEVSPPARLRPEGFVGLGAASEESGGAKEAGETPRTDPAVAAPEPRPAAGAAVAAEPAPAAAPAEAAAPVAAPAAPPADWYADPLARHQYRYWDGSAWTEHVADNGQASLDPLSAPAKDAGPIEFDADGHVKKITLPESGQWSVERKGQFTYYSRRANTLLEATELLRKVEDIPPVTYYAVDTPDGSLGRDVNGFYTEAPLKTSGLRLLTSAAVRAPVEFSSLTLFGDMMANQSVVASMKQQGQYTRFILQMECGRCGYKSPIESVSGNLTRQCYCCGAKNSGTRGSIDVVGPNGQMVEI